MTKKKLATTIVHAQGFTIVHIEPVSADQEGKKKPTPEDKNFVPIIGMCASAFYYSSVPQCCVRHMLSTFKIKLHESSLKCFIVKWLECRSKRVL